MSKFAYTSCTSSFSSSASIRRRVFFAALSSSRLIVVLGTIVSSEESTSIPACSSASRTAVSDSGAAMTRKLEPSRSTSSAPPSAAASITSSSSKRSASTRITPRRSNNHATEPEPPRLPSCLLNAARTSAAVRLRLSVSASTITATPFGPYPSYTTCSNAWAAASAPEPRAIARSMFSFGIEYERAFSTALASARFAAGSAPPSRAATMIARESFEKSLPRLASAAPFLCLIELHLLCPDIRLLLHQLEEPLVDARVVGQLWMEGGDQNPARSQQYGLAVQLGQHLDLRADLLHPGSADEDTSQRLLVAGKLEVRLEAGHLPAVGVTADGQVEQAEVSAVEQDHPRARAQDGPCKAPNRRLEPVE